jgi:hypothetical protein
MIVISGKAGDCAAFVPRLEQPVGQRQDARNTAKTAGFRIASERFFNDAQIAGKEFPVSSRA